MTPPPDSRSAFAAPVGGATDGTDVPARRRAVAVRRLVLAGAGIVAVLVMPLIVSEYPLFLLCYALVFSIAALGLNLLLGHTGLLSLGHAAFFGVGAYTGGFLMSFGLSYSLEVFILVGVLASTALAVVIGLLCVKTAKMNFAILTLAFGMLVHAVFINGAVFRLMGPEGWYLYLNAGGGLYIHRLTMLGEEVSADKFITAFFYIIAVFFLLTAIVLWRVSRSPFGQALRAIRDNETRAWSIGIPVWRYRWYVFIASGFLVGLAGALSGQLNRQITIEQLNWVLSAILVLMVVLGGMRHFWGPVVGAFVYVGLEEVALRWAGVHNFVLGLLLIIVVCAFPRGIAGMCVDFADKVKRLPWVSGERPPFRTAGPDERSRQE